MELLVGDQRHAAASHLENGICGHYLWQNRNTKSWWIFFQEKEVWLSKENIPVNRKKKGEADKEKDRGLPPWPSEQPRPKNTILGLRLSLAKEKLRVRQLSKNSQMPSAPQEEKHFYQEHITCHLSHGLFLHPSLPHLSDVCKWCDYHFSQGKRAFDFAPSCWIDEEFATEF